MRYILVLLVSCLSIGCATSQKNLFTEMEALANQGSPEAQYYLGMFYNNGIGTTQDTSKAFQLFEKSATAGDPLGNYKLGCYYAGQGQGVVNIDIEKALKYKLVSAQDGYALAQYDVANIYYEKGNVEEALKWWDEAAHQGESTSIYTLYTLYSTETKIPKDGVAAYGYLKLIERNAAKEHQSIIKEKLNDLETKFSLSPSQLQQAQEFATNWVLKPTPLTIKALSGLEEPKRFIEQEVNP